MNIFIAPPTPVIREGFRLKQPVQVHLVLQFLWLAQWEVEKIESTRGPG
jgi:hypothetical protein